MSSQRIKTITRFWPCFNHRRPWAGWCSYVHTKTFSRSFCKSAFSICRKFLKPLFCQPLATSWRYLHTHTPFLSAVAPGRGCLKAYFIEKKLESLEHPCPCHKKRGGRACWSAERRQSREGMERSFRTAIYPLLLSNLSLDSPNSKPLSSFLFRVVGRMMDDIHEFCFKICQHK